MGPLKLIQNLPDNFLVMNGDILTDLNYSDFYDFHVSRNNMFTISSYFREHSVDYGVLESDSKGVLIGFKEKPKLAYEVSMGVYMMNRKAVELIPPKINYGFDGLMLDLIDSGDSAVVKRFDGYWLDIGRPDDYAQAIDQFDSMKSKFLNG
jgi:NDP-sugar pyrophosphorylase family protein